MNLVVMGPPGSGKSTQAKILAQKLSLPYIQTGEIFRQIAKKKTPQARRIKKILEQGKLVSDEETVKTLEEFLSGEKGKDGFVLDGAPRTLPQAKKFKIKFDRVFYLAVGEKEIMKRLLARARADDTVEVINKRLKVFRRRTEPVLAFFRSRGILAEVDGEDSVEAIHQDILKRLEVQK